MRRARVVGFLLLLTVSLAAQSATFEQITVAATAIGFSPNVVQTGSGRTAATKAVCRLETAEIRYRIDGPAPTTTVGTLLEPGDVLVITGTDPLARFLAIRTGASSGVLDCTYSS